MKADWIWFDNHLIALAIAAMILRQVVLIASQTFLKNSEAFPSIAYSQGLRYSTDWNPSTPLSLAVFTDFAILAAV